jgi:hypothetical protein
MLTQLEKFARTEYNKNFDVNFAEKIETKDKKEALGVIFEKQIWLKVDQPLTDAILLEFYGLSVFPCLKSIKLIEGEQYFFALLHEIAHCFHEDDNPACEDLLVNAWAVNEFKNKRKIIEKMLP